MPPLGTGKIERSPPISVSVPSQIFRHTSSVKGKRPPKLVNMAASAPVPPDGACQAAELAVAAEGGNAGIRTEDKRAGETGVEEDGQMEVGSGGEFSDDGEPQKPRSCHDAAGA